jgi:hypothetical protein
MAINHLTTLIEKIEDLGIKNKEINVNEKAAFYLVADQVISLRIDNGWYTFKKVKIKIWQGI